MAGALVEPPERLCAPLRLRGVGGAELEALVDAAVGALFEIAGVLAVAEVEGIGPAPEEPRAPARWGAGEGAGDHEASVILEVAVLEVADDAVLLAIAWQGRAMSGRVERRWRWRDRGGAPQAIPAAARVGLRALCA
ncbi:MAG: hypothetical protein H6711_05945 [Myxococcales bacterium]|nr:hypothetical protein [Myxococcales bacterium]